MTTIEGVQTVIVILQGLAALVSQIIGVIQAIQARRMISETTMANKMTNNDGKVECQDITPKERSISSWRYFIMNDLLRVAY